MFTQVFLLYHKNWKHNEWEASQKWGISERRIQKLCEESRIEGALRFSRIWMIPKNAEKPADARKKPESDK